MLLAPFLGRWTYTRVHEQIAGGQKYRPPAADVNAPDLFLPLMAAWTYALINCCLLAAKGAFKPEAMSNMVGRRRRGCVVLLGWFCSYSSAFPA